MEKDITKEMFLKLSTEQKLDVCNARLTEVFEGGMTTSDFGKGNLKFSYSWALKILSELGFAYDAKLKKFVPKEELSHNPITRNSKNKASDNLKAVYLSDEEIAALRQLLDENKQKENNKTFEPLLRSMVNMKNKNTSFSIKADILETWKVFSKQYAYVSSTDLISAALLFFVQHFDNENK